MTDQSVQERSSNVPQKQSALYSQVAHQVTELQQGYLNDRAWAVAALAKLRRGIGKQPGDLIDLIEWTTAGLFIADNSTDEPTAEEQAAYTAITLYAMHQQGKREKPMHRTGPSFGKAAHELRIALGQDREAGVVRAFNAIGTARDITELARHARRLIQLFRANDVGMDYALFATDLRKLMNPAAASQVRNRWGRDFHWFRRSVDGDQEPENKKSLAPAHLDPVVKDEA